MIGKDSACLLFAVAAPRSNLVFLVINLQHEKPEINREHEQYKTKLVSRLKAVGGEWVVCESGWFGMAHTLHQLLP